MENRSPRPGERGRSTFIDMKILKILGISIGTFLGVCLIGLIILGSFCPETYIYLGHQVPKKYMKEIRSLGLLEDGEKIKYFYTDGIFDIKNGLYFVSDKNLTLYSAAWEEPRTIISFKSINLIEVEYDDSFFLDTYVTVQTDEDLEVIFPISSEQGRDKKFVEYLSVKSEVEPVAGGDATR